MKPSRSKSDMDQVDGLEIFRRRRHRSEATATLFFEKILILKLSESFQNQEFLRLCTKDLNSTPHSYYPIVPYSAYLMVLKYFKQTMGL